MKRRRTITQFLSYVRHHLLAVASSPPRLFAVVVGGLGTATALKGAASDFGLWPVAIVLILVVGTFLWLVANAFNHSIGSLKEHELRYVAYAPPTTEDNVMIGKAAGFFGAAAIDSADGLAAMENDPFSCVILRDGKGKAIGFADYYCFQHEAFDEYCGGRLNSTDLFADHYLHHPEARRAPVLYISTIFRYDFITNRSFQGRCETALLAWCLARLILAVQENLDEGVTIYSYGETEAGRRALVHFGFVESGKSNPEGHRLMWIPDARRTSLEAILDRYRFLGAQCDFSLLRPIMASV